MGRVNGAGTDRTQAAQSERPAARAVGLGRAEEAAEAVDGVGSKPDETKTGTARARRLSPVPYPLSPVPLSPIP